MQHGVRANRAPHKSDYGICDWLLILGSDFGASSHVSNTLPVGKGFGMGHRHNFGQCPLPQWHALGRRPQHRRRSDCLDSVGRGAAVCAQIRMTCAALCSLFYISRPQKSRDTGTCLPCRRPCVQRFVRSLLPLSVRQPNVSGARMGDEGKAVGWLSADGVATIHHRKFQIVCTRFA
jgi:hypothetical protein